MKDYNILSAETQEELCDLVREAIKNGWQPVGGVACFVVKGSEDTVWEYNQAMFLQ